VRLYLNDGVSVLLPTLADANAPLPVTAGVDAPFDPASVKQTIPRGIPVDDLYRKDLARREALFCARRWSTRRRGISKRRGCVGWSSVATRSDASTGSMLEAAVRVRTSECDFDFEATA